MNRLAFSLVRSLVCTSRLAGLAALFVVCPALVVGCSAEPKSSSSAPKGAAKGGDTDAKAGADARKGDGHGPTAVVDGGGADDRYVMKVDVPTELSVGTTGKATVKITPNAPWHMNLDYPTSLKLEATDGVTIAKLEQKKGDAAKLDESGCQYDIELTADAGGERVIPGKLKFAICQDDACMPLEADVEVKVAAK